MFKIFLIDDHQVFTESLKMMLMHQFSLQNDEIYTFNSEEVFFKNLSSIKLQVNDIVLLDINFSKLLNGVDICKEILRQVPTPKVIALSMHHERRYVTGMIQAGASGYLLKTAPFEEIKKAILEVQNGKKYFSEELEKMLNKSSLFSKLLDELNPKEKRILDGIKDGKTNQKMADEMGVSIKTIEFYRKGLFIKFGVNNSHSLLAELNKQL